MAMNYTRSRDKGEDVAEYAREWAVPGRFFCIAQLLWFNIADML